MSSSRMKRLLKELSDIRGGSPSKRRRHPSASDDEDLKSPTQLNCPDVGHHVNNIYNSGTGKKPAELFRKDLISAMKLADSDQLDPNDYIVINDQWKPEWEKGVQVPVNPDSLPLANVRLKQRAKASTNFRLPKKLVRLTHNENFDSEVHTLVDVSAKAEKVCRYDMDMLDDQWLSSFNQQSLLMGMPYLSEHMFENIIEEFEIECYSKIQDIIQNEQGFGIEYDEDVICDVCRSPDSEDGNEMVFCDCCDICVHQACYGIQDIPEGSWLCKPCSLQLQPSCVLCPNVGGAMKPVKNGNKWSHVSCALWIPEVSIGCVDNMEPITKIQQIPASRWNLICSECKEKNGACIQCTVKSCKTAYHVTCAFKHCLQMKAIVEPHQPHGADVVKLKSYCDKHSTKSNKETDAAATATNYSMSEHKGNVRNARLHQLELHFYEFVDVAAVAQSVHLSLQLVDFVYNYWKLKRFSNFGKPLLRPKEVETDLMNKQQEDSLYEKIKMFVHIRQDLERVRNLCYMVTRREKLCRSLLKTRSDVFNKQNELLTDPGGLLSMRERNAVLHANHIANIYDMAYSHVVPVSHKYKQLSSILCALTATPKTDSGHKVVQPNPYAKQYNANRTKRQSVGAEGKDQSDDSSVCSVESFTRDIGDGPHGGKPTNCYPIRSRQGDSANETASVHL